MGLFRRETRAGAPAEQRDPNAATQSLRYIGRNSYSPPPDWDAARAYDVAYYMDPITYACVQATASTIAGLPFRAGLDPTNRKAFNPNAALAKLLGSEPPNGPAPGMGASDLWFAAVRDYIVTGRFGWEIETEPGETRPLYLWPLTAAALKPIPTTGGAQWFKGFEYGRPDDMKKLRPEQVFYVWNPSGNDYRQPESPLRAASVAVNVSIMQGTFDYNFLKNDARPASVVVTEEFEDDDSFQAFKQQWNGEHRGPHNAGKAAFIEATGVGDQGVKGAVEVIPLGTSAKDSQANQRAEARQREIAMALGVPWSRLDASGRTFDNASQEDEIWWRQRLIPLIARLQNAVNVQLAPLLGPEFGWFDLSEVPVLTTHPVTVTPIDTPAVTPPVTTVPDTVPKPDLALAATAPDGEIRKMHEYEGDAETCDLCGKPSVHQAHGYFMPRSLAREAPDPAPVSVVRGPDPSPVPAPVDHEQRRAKIWTSTNGKVRNLERQWERALRKLFARQARSAVARLEGKRGRGLVTRADIRATGDEVFDPTHWLTETIDDVTALYEAVTAAGGARVSDLFGLAFDIEAPYAQDFVQARAKQLAGQVTETTYTQIKDALAEGIGEGESIPDLSARIKHVFEVASDSRATTIARTEVVSAFNGSASLTANEYGADVVGGQEWIATSDSRTRDEHAARDGEIVGIDETFSGGLAYPGDPSGDPADTVNCRCTVAFLTPDEMGSRSGGRSRTVETRVAASVLRMVKPGAEDVETGIRAALKVAA